MRCFGPLFCLLTACTTTGARNEPEPPATAEARPSASPGPVVLAASPSASPAPPPVITSASAAPTPEGVAPTAVEEFPLPKLVGVDDKPLPQTEDKPRTDSPFFEAAARRLFDAIVKDDPELALPFFFPVQAYEQVKDVQNPARDWQQRLVRLFRRDVHEYHRALGKRRGEARFLRIEVPEARAEWMKPGREGNRLGYYRVLRSRLLYADPDGKERALEITSFISWRGEWYVVHLHGFE